MSESDSSKISADADKKDENEIQINEKSDETEPPKVPSNTQTIYYQDINDVDVTQLDPDTEQLDFSHSKLNSVGNLTKFTNLKSICYRNNLFKTLLDENLKVENGLDKIKELDFYDNQIVKIENLEKFITLENLDLSFNYIKKIENLDCLVNLIKLYLVHNQITKIENLNCFKNLELLELGDNQIRQIENLDSLVNLKQLYLGKNKIKKLENLNLPNLSILSIQSNRITKIENLDNLVNLSELYFSDNGITKMEGLDKLAKLKVLDLSNNLIENIENIENLKELEEFWFNNNNLANWKDIDNLKALPKLKCLYLEHNPIYYQNNIKPLPMNLTVDNQMKNSAYRRKIIFTLPNLEQLDATLCTKPSV